MARAVCAREGDSRWWLDGGVCGSSYRWWCRLSVVLPFLLFSAANTLTLAGSGDRPPGDANGEHPPFVVCPAFFGSPYHRPRPPRRTLMPWQATGTGRGPDARRALLRYSDRRPRLPARTRVPARPSVTRPTDPQRRASNRSGRLPPPALFAFQVPSTPSRARAPFCVRRECARGGRRMGLWPTQPTVHQTGRPAGCHGQRRQGSPTTQAPCVSRPSKRHKKREMTVHRRVTPREDGKAEKKTRHPRSRSVRHAPRPETR